MCGLGLIGRREEERGDIFEATVVGSETIARGVEDVVGIMCGKKVGIAVGDSHSDVVGHIGSEVLTSRHGTIIFEERGGRGDESHVALVRVVE